MILLKVNYNNENDNNTVYCNKDTIIELQINVKGDRETFCKVIMKLLNAI